MVKVSVLIPVYNEERKINICLDSILQSNVNFQIEILIGNDCSTDGTLSVAELYKRKYPAIVKVINNEKNLGNGRTFSRLLKQAEGEYFHVLDADDYWTDPEKLQRQVDFLDGNSDYAIAAHNTDRRNEVTGESHLVIIPEAAKRIKNSIIDAKSVLAGEVYFHTSSLLYRNVYKDNVPDFLENKWGGGDVIRMRIHSLHGKLKYFDEVWSVYNYTGAGIWSSLTRREQLTRQVKASWYWFRITPFHKKIYSWICFSKSLYKLSECLVESQDKYLFKAFKFLAYLNLGFFLFATRRDILKRELGRTLNRIKKSIYQAIALVFHVLRGLRDVRVPRVTQDVRVPRVTLSRRPKIFSFYPLEHKFITLQEQVKNKKFGPAAYEYKRLISSLAYPKLFRSLVFAAPVPAVELSKAAYEIGRGILDQSKSRSEVCLGSQQHDPIRKAYVILTSGLGSKGGGTFAEIESLITLFPENAEVHLVSSCVTAPAGSRDVEERLLEIRNIEFHYADNGTLQGKIRQLHGFLSQLKPEKIYLYHSHHDITTLASLQSDVVHELYLGGHLDHGLNPGIGHPMVTAYIVNRPWAVVYYSEYLGIQKDKLRYMPPYLPIKVLPPRANFQAVIKHANCHIRSATMAARSYKLLSDYEYPYGSVIADALSVIPNMVHHHFGPLSNRELDKIRLLLKKKNIDQKRFVHVPWFDLKKGLWENFGVNVYLQSWPVSGTRSSLHAMSEGIPIVQHINKHSSQFSSIDYVYPDSHSWEVPSQLLKTLKSVDSDWILEQSKKSRRHFIKYYSENEARFRFANFDNDICPAFSVKMQPFYFINLRSLTKSRRLNFGYALTELFYNTCKMMRRS